MAKFWWSLHCLQEPHSCHVEQQDCCCVQPYAFRLNKNVSFSRVSRWHKASKAMDVCLLRLQGRGVAVVGLSAIARPTPI